MFKVKCIVFNGTYRYNLVHCKRSFQLNHLDWPVSIFHLHILESSIAPRCHRSYCNLNMHSNPNRLKLLVFQLRTAYKFQTFYLAVFRCTFLRQVFHYEFEYQHMHEDWSYLYDLSNQLYMDRFQGHRHGPTKMERNLLERHL